MQKGLDLQLWVRVASCERALRWGVLCAVCCVGAGVCAVGSLKIELPSQFSIFGEIPQNPGTPNLRKFLCEFLGQKKTEKKKPWCFVSVYLYVCMLYYPIDVLLWYMRHDQQ